MSNSRGGADGALILTPQDAKRLRQAYPDLHEWPESWQVELADIAIGQQIVQLLMPFLLYLLDQGLAKTTVRRHRDNIWSLGAEVIRRRYDDGELARQDVPAAVQELIGEDGGPLIWPRMTEAEQDSLDTSCRKLHRFMQELKAAPKSGGGKAKRAQARLGSLTSTAELSTAAGGRRLRRTDRPTQWATRVKRSDRPQIAHK